MRIKKGKLDLLFVNKDESLFYEIDKKSLNFSSIDKKSFDGYFDLCRLSMTILEELNLDNYSENFINFMNKMCIDKEENSFLNMPDDFRLYINIAKYACNSLPREIIMNDIFNEYRIKKKLFPRKSYYTI